MPQAIPAVVGFAKVFFTSQALGFVAARFVLGTIALQAISRALTPRPSAPPQTVTIRGPIENRRLVFGTRRVGGVMVFYATSGNENRYLWYVLAVAGHQVSDIRDVWLDTVLIEDSEINGGTGAVTSTEFNGVVSIWRYLGTSAQTADSNLDSTFSNWTSDHRLRATAYMVVRMEKSNKKFPSGAPQNVTALVDGMLCYDPREGGHDPADPSTWAFTRNPALHARWYLTGGSVINDLTTRNVKYGLREDDARIDDSYVIAAANICDETMTGTEQPPSGDQPRYRCDLEASAGETRRQILDSILATMAGTLTYVHGQWRMYAGAYDVPAHALDQDDLYGDIEARDTAGHEDRYNAVSAVFPDAANQYIDQTTPPRTNSSYETQDGGEQKLRELVLRGVTDQYQAQRLCEIELQRSRQMRTVQVPGTLELLAVAPHETFTLSHAGWGWNQKVFRCRQRKLQFEQGAGSVTLVGDAENSAVYTDLLTADYTTGTSATDSRQTETPDAPTALTATSLPGVVRLNVTLPEALLVGAVVEIWEYTASTPFASATKIAEGLQDVFDISHRDTTTRYYWATIRSADGIRSTNYPAGGGAAGVADLVATTDIDTGAATVLHSDDDAGPFTVTDSTGGFSVESQMFYLTFTPAVSCNVIVRVMTKAYSSNALQFAYVQPFISLSDGSSRLVGGRKSVTNTATELYAVQKVFAVTGGTTYRAGLLGEAEYVGAAVTLTCTDVDVIVEEIKR